MVIIQFRRLTVIFVLILESEYHVYQFSANKLMHHSFHLDSTCGNGIKEKVQ